MTQAAAAALSPATTVQLHRADVLVDVGSGRLAAAAAAIPSIRIVALLVAVIEPDVTREPAWAEAVAQGRLRVVDRRWRQYPLTSADGRGEYLHFGLGALAGVGQPADLVHVDGPLPAAWIAQSLLLGTRRTVAVTPSDYATPDLDRVLEPLADSGESRYYAMREDTDRQALRMLVRRVVDFGESP